MAERIQTIARQISVVAAKEVNLSLVDVEVSADGRIGLIFFNRQKELNALNDAIILAMNNALLSFENDPNVACVVLSGRGKAFAAGADIKEMATKTVADMLRKDKIAPWEEVLPKMRKPVIAAVNGVALGGGCEVAMMCDIIIASEKALFGQPEIKLGLIPGAGGTQRLTKAVGKSLSMQMNLTGEPMKPQRMLEAGLISEVVPHNSLIDRALEVAGQISRHSQVSLMNAKEAVGKSFETSLQEGLRFERRLFHAGFGLEDAKEGMAAFSERRKAIFKDM